MACLPLLSGCALRGPVAPDPGLLRIAAQTELQTVPFFPQKAFQCGPAALAMVLHWSGLKVRPDDLVPMVYVPDRRGSLQTGLISAARRHGRLAYPFAGEDCLLRELAAGHPVIVLQNLGLRWAPKWHYAVVIGYDLSRQVMVLHTGLQAVRQVPYATFARTWHRAGRWALVALPAGRLPACAEEHPFLKAALGLAQSGHREQTLIALQAAADQWPRSPEVQMALGNAWYADGDLTAAVQAFENAARLAPQNGAAFNNLAHVLAQQGRWDQAEAAARRAIGLGGTRSDLYRQTLQEILERRPESKALK